MKWWLRSNEKIKVLAGSRSKIRDIEIRTKRYEVTRQRLLLPESWDWDREIKKGMILKLEIDYRGEAEDSC